MLLDVHTNTSRYAAALDWENCETPIVLCDMFKPGLPALIE
jgi:hypothetical protein